MMTRQPKDVNVKPGPKLQNPFDRLHLKYGLKSHVNVESASECFRPLIDFSGWPRFIKCLQSGL